MSYSSRERCLVQHPGCPLPFELRTMCPADAGLDESSQVLLPPQTFDNRWVARFNTPAMAQAAKMALHAYQVRECHMVREVFTACLRLADGVCPEAYNLLASKTASNLQEALELYSKAESLCPLLCDDFDALCGSGDLWASAEHLHCYMRAVLGLANTLRKMGRHEEALQKYLLLSVLENGAIEDTYFPNFRYHIPQIMILLGDWDGAERYMLVESRKHHDVLFADDGAALIAWVWTLTLLSYHRESSDGKTPLYPIGPLGSDLIENYLNGTVVFSALQCNTDVLPLLMAGVIDCPPLMYSSDPGCKAQALAYVHDQFCLWQAMPDAVEWVRRCHCTAGALRHLALQVSPEEAKFSFFESCVHPELCSNNSSQECWRERSGLSQRKTCDFVFRQLDLDGNGTISAIELKLWFQKVISEVADHDLPHHLLKFKGGGSMPRWTDALHLVDVNDDETITYEEFWEFWNLPRPALFLEAPSVNSHGESFIQVLIRSPRSRTTHLKAICDVMIRQGLQDYEQVLTEAVASLVLRDDRPDLFEVFVTYNAELRGVVVRELDRLFHCAAIQGSWRAMHLLLREFISLQQPVELLEGLRHILRSKAYFGVAFRDTGSTGCIELSSRAPSANHSWCKCVDALVFHGLGSWCLRNTLDMISDSAMKKLVKKLVKHRKQMQVPQLSADNNSYYQRCAPIQTAPSSPPPFERWHSGNALQIEDQIYQPVFDRSSHANGKAKSSTKEWHRLHPLYVHLLQRLEEEPLSVKEEVSLDLRNASAETNREFGGGVHDSM